MRRYLASLALMASAAAPAFSAASGGSETDASAVAAQQVRVPTHGLRDEVAMVLVGSALIGLAAAVRRTT
jgi:hypothetical protein